MNPNQTIIGLIALAFICVVGIGIGVLAAGYMPEVIDLTAGQEANIINQQERICKNSTRDLEKQMKDLQKARDRAFDLVEKNYDYYEEFTRALENKEYEPDFNITVQVHDNNIMDFNEFDINVMVC